MAQLLDFSTPARSPEPAPSQAQVQEVPPVGAGSSQQDTARAMRIGLLALAVGFGGFVLWAAFAPLDEGVPSQGSVTLDTKRKAVQHLTGGIVKAVLVGEGEQVKEGQVLMRLDDAGARAGFEAVRHRYLGLRAMQGRLAAEQAGLPSIVFHPELVREAQDPLIRQQVTTQEQLFRSRRAALRADLQATQESIEGQQALVDSYRKMSASRRGQLALLSEELGHTRELVKEGYVPRNRQLELERMAAETSASLAELQGSLLRAHRSIAELHQRLALRQQEYRTEVEGQLADVVREVEADEGKFHALRDELQRMEIRSPADGQVVGVAVQTVGAVLAPGQKLMDIVPAHAPLLLEARLAPHLIDRVHAGLAVDVRFAAFAHSPQLVVDGKVASVSGDLLTDAQTHAPYYLARITLTDEGYRQLGRRTLQPGMPVEVVLRTGERSLLAYLLHPLTRRMAAAMKEE